MPIGADSVLGAIAGTIEFIGGKPPFKITIADSPNDFSGWLDIAETDQDHVFEFTLNEAGVINLPSNFPLTGSITVIDAAHRSATFGPFTIGTEGGSIGGGAAISISPTTGSFFDDAELDTVVIHLATVNASSPLAWSIVSGFDNGGANVLLDMQADGTMTLNADGVTYYGANPGDGTLTGFVTLVDADGRSPDAPVEITLTVFASATAVVGSISMLHAIA